VDRSSISAVKFWIRALKRWQLSPDASEYIGYCFDLKQASLDISGAHLLAEATLSFPQGIQTAKRRSERPQKPCLLSDQGKYKQVEEIHRQALGLWETVLGKEHSSTLTSINNLASVLSHQGKYGQVEEMYRQTLGLRDAVLGKEHASTLLSVNNLANMLSRRKRFSEADAHTKAQRLRENLTPSIILPWRCRAD
jgi:hypothetical protein